MKVALGVSSGNGAATIALLDAAPPHALIDQYRVDLAAEPITSLVSTLASTERDLTQSGHTLVCTRISSADAGQAETLANALLDAALTDVAVVSESDAVAELARSLSGDQTTAAVVIDGETASLSIVDPRADTSSLIAIEPIKHGDRMSAYAALLERFHEEPGGATSVLVLGSSDAVDATRRSPIAASVPVVIPDDPEFAVARAAALMAFRSGLESEELHGMGADAVTQLGPQMQQLAYSEANDSGEFPAFPRSVPTQTPMRPLSAVDLDALESAAADDPPVRPRVLLIGSTVAAVVVVGFAALAVTVAINIRPAVSEQAVRIQDEAVPGKYFPQAPGQGVKPDGDNWTVIEKLPPPGQTSDVRVFEPRALTPVSSASQSAPVELRLYSDGTLGMGGVPPAATPAVALPDVGSGAGVAPSAAPAVALPDGGGPGTGLVARLIPDLSKIDMTQVITALINKPRQTNPLAAMATTLASLNNAGSIGVVKANQGPILTGKPVQVLSGSPAAIVQQLAAGANAATLATVPKEIPPAPVVAGPPLQRVPEVATPDAPAQEVETPQHSSTAPGAKPSTASTPGVKTSEAKTTTARPSPEQTSATKAPESSPTKSSAPSSAPSSESSTAKAPTTGGASTATSAAPSPADVAQPSPSPAPETSKALAPVNTPSVPSRAPARVAPEPTSAPEPEPAPVVQAPAPVVEAPPPPPAPVVVAPPAPAVVAPVPVPVAPPPPPPPAPAPAAPAPAPSAPAPAVELPLPRITLPLITTTAVPTPADPSS